MYSKNKSQAKNTLIPSQKETSNSLYNEKVRELAENVPLIGVLDTPCASATARSRICGSSISVDLDMSCGIITDYRHSLRACVLGKCTAAILAKNIVSTSKLEFLALHQQLTDFLAGREVIFPGCWSELKLLEPARDYRSRHAAIMLSFDAVRIAVNQIAE